MPTWTTMNELVTGDLVTEADMAALRENITYLLDPNRAGVVHSDNHYTTTSTSFVNVDSIALSLALTTHGGPVLVTFTGNAYAVSANYKVRFDLAVDGERTSGAALGLLQLGDLGASADAARPASFAVLVSGLAAGAHTFALQWCVPAGNSVTLVAHTSYSPITLAAIEL